MKVLVVEDDPNLRGVFLSALETSGRDVHCVATEAEARVALLDSAFDLVLLDLCLKGRDGLDVTAYATYRNPNCRVVLISGACRVEDGALNACDSTVAAVLSKPVDLEDLLDVADLVERMLPSYSSQGPEPQHLHA